MRATSKTRTRLILGAAIGALFASAAQAQTPRSDLTVDEIVVVARKQAELLIDVPLAITALTAEDLEVRGVVDYKTLSDFTPGMKFQNQSVNRNDRGFHTFTIRGMYPGSDAPERQAVTVFVDGNPVLGGSLAGLDNVERVEVVEGPQSAYFGRATFSGAVNFITKAPSFERAASAEALIGSFDTHEFKGSIEGGLIGDVLAARLSGRYFETGGQYRNFGYSNRLGAQQTYSGTLSLLFTPTEKLRVRAMMTAWRDNDGPPASGQFSPAEYNCRTPGATTPANNYICGEIDNPPSYLLTQQTAVGSVVIDYLRGARGPGNNNLPVDFIDSFGLQRDATQATLSVEYALPGGFDLAVNAGITDDAWGFITDTSFRDTRTNFFRANPSYGTVPDVLPYFSRSAMGSQIDKGRSIEARISAPEFHRIKTMLGVNYFEFDSQRLTNAYGNTGFSNPAQNTLSETQTYGIFGSINYEIGAGFDISLEGRWQSDKISQRVRTATGVHLTDTFTSFTPRAILTYKPNDDVTIYTSYARGTRPGAFNTTLFSRSPSQQAEVLAQLNAPIAIPEETLDMYDFGVKGQFFDRRLRILSAIYYGQWRDKHILQKAILTGPPLQTLQVTVPGGEIDLMGVELQGTFRATRALTFDGTFNYAETKIKYSFCTECFALLGQDYVKDNRMPRYPAYTASFSTTYRRELFADYDGFIRADYIYTGRQYDSETNLAWTAPANRVNFRAGIDNGRIKVELYGTNIFDDKSPLSVARNTDTYTGANALSFSPADRAAFGVHVAATF